MCHTQNAPHTSRHLPRSLAHELHLFEQAAYKKLLDGAAEAAGIDDGLESNTYRCNMLGYQHGVLPGGNLDSLSPDQRKQWADLKCDDVIRKVTHRWQMAGGGHFRDLSIALPLHRDLVKPSDGSGQGEKFFVGPHTVTDLGKDFIVYGAGNAGEPDFEIDMARRGAKVYSFDCTIRKAKPEWESFTFHPWCIGTRASMEGNSYSKKSGVNESDYEFFSLAEIKKKLGHKHIDMLKMDIEGFEWDLLYNEIIKGKEEDLPEQLLFELHTEGVSGYYVPVRPSTGKGRKAVTQLALDLYDRNYRMVNFELNNGDHHAAEMVFIRFPA